jgi:Na+-driven multidrug efflux pump
MAVAIATAVSQVIGATLCMIKLMTNKGICSFRIKGMRFCFSSFKKIIKNGLPLAVSSALYPFSNLQIQTQLNELGSAVVAGSAAAANIESLVASLGSSAMTSTVTVFVGYNIGAKRYDRVKKSMLACLALGVGASLLAAVICMTFSAQIASLYVTGDDSVRAAQIRMLTNVLFYFIACSQGVVGHVIQAFGYSFLSTFNSIFWVFCFRIFWMLVVYPPVKDLSAPLESMFYIAVCWPISWTCVLITNLAFFFFLYYKRFKKGRLKSVG